MAFFTGFLTNLSIRNKLLAAFSSLLLLTLLLGLFAISRIEFLDTRASAIEANATADQPLGVMAKDAYKMLELAEAAHIDATLDRADAAHLPPGALAAIAAAEASVNQEYKAAWSSYQPTMDPGRESHDGYDFNAAFGAIAAAAAQAAADDAGGNHGGACHLLTGEMKTALVSFGKAMRDDLSYQAAESGGLVQEAHQASARGMLWVGLILAFAAIGTLAAGWLIVRDVALPIGAMTLAMRKLAGQDMNVSIPGIGRRDEIGAMADSVRIFKDNAQERRRLEMEAAEAARQLESERSHAETAREEAAAAQAQLVKSIAGGLERLANGDLLYRLTTRFAPDYETLRRDFNNAMDRLQATLRAVAASTRSVQSGAGEITAASDDLARRTEKQATSLEQTAAALGEITATVRKTAEGAAEARELATESKTHQARLWA